MNKPAFTIRYAQPDDAARLAELHVASWQTAYRGIVADAVLDSLKVADRLALWQEILASSASFTLVAVTDQVIGFAAGGAIRKPLQAYTGELYSLYLHPSVYRQGIGRRLFLRFAQEIHKQGMASMMLWVLKDNSARHFYEALDGVYLSEKIFTIGEQALPEISYGWPDLAQFLAKKDQL